MPCKATDAVGMNAAESGKIAQYCSLYKHIPGILFFFSLLNCKVWEPCYSIFLVISRYRRQHIKLTALVPFHWRRYLLIDVLLTVHVSHTSRFSIVKDFFKSYNLYTGNISLIPKLTQAAIQTTPTYRRRQYLLTRTRPGGSSTDHWATTSPLIPHRYLPLRSLLPSTSTKTTGRIPKKSLSFITSVPLKFHIIRPASDTCWFLPWITFCSGRSTAIAVCQAGVRISSCASAR